MKLRLTHNSIRIRVRKSELTALAENRSIEETVKFPNNSEVFTYALVIDSKKNEISAEMIGFDLRVMIPIKIAKEWINTNEVGIESHIDLVDEDKLHLLIEKDFPCLDRPTEDKSDTFWELASDNSENQDTC